MKKSTIFVGFILLSMAVLYAKAANSCSCSCGDHEDSTPHQTPYQTPHQTPYQTPHQIPHVKQCVFKSLNDDRDKGQIETCDFQKVHSKSALRVTYQGDMRLVSCGANKCCRRWFITINGKECSSPAPIDAAIYANGVSRLNLHRPGTLDGFCDNIPKGPVTMALSVGKCDGVQDSGDAFTCWNSVCRFIIEEIPMQ